MQALALTARLDGFREALVKAAALKPNIVVIFAAPSFWRDGGAMADACTPLQGTHLIGCSTAGEISASGAADDTCSIMAMRFDHAQVKIAAAQLGAMDASRSAGQSIGEALKESGLRGVFALCPGLQVDGSAFAGGIAAAVGDKVTVAGGLAGDGLDFRTTCTMLNGMVFTNLAVAFGIYGDKASMATSTRCGWKPFGLMRRVTKSAANVIFQLDGKPALDLYRKYAGEQAPLPAGGLLYPFSLLREDGRDTGVVRMVLAVNPADGSMTMAGDVPQGSLLRLMYADPDLLVSGAAAAGKEAVNGHAGQSATLLVNCAGRRLAMGEDANAEIDAVIQSASGGACAGFYSYGEIAPVPGSARADVQNQSIAVTHIAEGP